MQRSMKTSKTPPRPPLVPGAEVALLGDATRLVVVPLDGATAGGDHPPQSLSDRGILGGPVVALTRHHDLQARYGLRREPESVMTGDSSRSNIGIKTLTVAMPSPLISSASCSGPPAGWCPRS